MDDVAAWFLALYKATGIKLTIFYDAYDRGRFLQGFVTTVKLSAYCLVGESRTRRAGRDAAGRARRGDPARGDAAFVQLFRNTPPLVQLYFFYFRTGAAAAQESMARRCWDRSAGRSCR